MKESVARIVRPILLPLGLSFVLLLLTFLFGVGWLGGKHASDRVNATSTSIEQAFLQGIDSLALALDGHLYLISKRECLPDAWVSIERQNLFECMSVLYPGLSNQYDVVDFAFYTLEQKTLLSFLHPKLYGNLVKRSTLDRARNTDETSFGLNLSSSGKLILRSVRPLQIGGKTVGFIELGVRINHLVENLSDSHNVGLLILIDKRYLDQAEFEQEYMGLEHVPWGYLTNYVVVKNTAEEVTDELMQHLDRSNGTKSSMRFGYEQNDRYYSSTHMPLIDDGGRIIGKVAMLIDTTGIRGSFRILLIVSSLFFAVVGSGLFLLLRAYLGKIQNRLTELYGALHIEIGERKRAELASRRLASAVEHSGSMVVVTDGGGTIEYVNPRFMDVTGYSSKEVLGANPRILKSGETAPREYEELWDTIKDGRHWYGELLNRKKTGELYWANVSISPVKSAGGKIVSFVAVSEDITERKESQNMIEHLAFHDALTGLPNRRSLLSHLEQVLLQIKRGKSIAAMFFMDLDRFKEVNDEMGHDAGDELLRAVAERVSDVLRGQDIVGRLGGDEFLVLLPKIAHQGDAAIVAQKIMHVMSEPVSLMGQEVDISFSIGITIIPRDGDSAEVLMKAADMAMYQAKDMGRNTFVFYGAEETI